MNRIPFYHGNVPHLTTEQMREVDRAMIEDYHILLIQMMENAGRNLAHLARIRFFESAIKNKRITILAGTGGNGGGALVCARRLHNYGAKVSVSITKEDQFFTPIPKHQLEILRRMNVPVFPAQDIQNTPSPDFVVDGLIGYSLKGPPRGNAAELIRWANEQDARILALDTPSGVDTTTGQVFEPAIKATATMTLALPKRGLLDERVAPHVGELYLADISVPPELYNSPALQIQVEALFAESDILRIR